MKLPHKRPRHDVERAKISGGRHVVFARCRPENDEVLEHLARRRRLRFDNRRGIAAEPLAQIDGPVFLMS